MTPSLKPHALKEKSSNPSLPSLRRQVSTSSAKAVKWVSRKLGKEKDNENDDHSISVSGPLSLMSPGRRQAYHPDNLPNVSPSTMAHIARQRAPERTDIPRPRNQILVDSGEIYNPLSPQSRMKTRLYQQSNASLNLNADRLKPLPPSALSAQSQSAQQRPARTPQSAPPRRTNPGPSSSAPMEPPTIIVVPPPGEHQISESHPRELHFIPYEISPGTGEFDFQLVTKD